MRTLRFPRVLPPLAAVLVLAAFAEDVPKLAPPEDVAFAKEAALGNLTEVAVGRLAVQKSADERVKKFGQHMIDDHTKAQEALRRAATREGVSRDVPGALDLEHEQVLERFRKLSGPELDEAYKKEMLKDHEEDVARFEKQAALGGNTPIQKFAAETLPTLQQHLKMARELAGTK